MAAPAHASTHCAPSQSVTVTCSGHVDAAAELATATKIKHVVVIFGENISYDPYFGTYPIAQNLAGEPAFSAQVSTPGSNNFNTPLDTTKGFAPLTGVDLLNKNPNLNTANGAGASNPFRLSPSQASTADQGHNYKPEQQASDNGLMDLLHRHAARWDRRWFSAHLRLARMANETQNEKQKKYEQTLNLTENKPPLHRVPCQSEPHSPGHPIDIQSLGAVSGRNHGL